MWSQLKACKMFSFVIDKRPKILVLEHKKKEDELGNQNIVILMAIGYNYDEYR